MNMFEKNRILIRRVIDGEKPVRDLHAEFVPVAAMHVVDDDDDEELVPDKVAHAQPEPEVAPVHAQGVEMDFWRKMDALMDRKTENAKTTVLRS